MNMKSIKKLVSQAFVLSLTSVMITGPALAQDGPFATAVQVNDGVITNFEVQQRISMLQAFGSSGDLRKIAIDGLIEDRLRQQAAKDLSVTINEDSLLAGMEEFAARGSLTVEQLIQYLAARGIDETTFRDFVSAGLVFRDVVSAKFGRSINVDDAEIDARLSLNQSNKISILMAELLLPNAERGDVRTLELATELSDSIRTNAAFSSAARRYSRAPSAARGGRLDWLEIANLPPILSGQLLALEEGEVSTPIALSGAVGIFQLRGVRTEPATEVSSLTLSYIDLPIPSSIGNADSRRASAQGVLNAVDNCADLRAKSEIYSADAFTEHVVSPQDVPAFLTSTLAGLDKDEAAITTIGDNTSIIMLCNRIRDIPDEGREGLRNALLNQRITGFGDGYLQELKGDAFIDEK